MPLPEVLQFLQQLPTKYAAIAAIGVTTGCRITEILSLRRFDLLKADGTMKERIPFLRLKTGCGTPIKPRERSDRRDTSQRHVCRHRFIGIPADYRPYILRHLIKEEQRGFERPDDYVFLGQQGKHLSRLTVYAVFRKFLGEGYGTHWMRKTFAQNLFRYYLAQNATDPMRALELTRQALGHERIDTTVKYLSIMESSLETAQNEIFKLK